MFRSAATVHSNTLKSSRLYMRCHWNSSNSCRAMSWKPINSCRLWHLQCFLFIYTLGNYRPVHLKITQLKRKLIVHPPPWLWVPKYEFNSQCKKKHCCTAAAETFFVCIIAARRQPCVDVLHPHFPARRMVMLKFSYIKPTCKLDVFITSSCFN